MEKQPETEGDQFLRDTANRLKNIANAGKSPNSPKQTFTYEEVQSLIQTVWSEFVELESGMHTPYFLRRIIEQEIEQNPFKPIQIFNK